jgi:putative ABC transport system permease protein
VLLESVLVSLAGGLIGVGLASALVYWVPVSIGTEGVVIPIVTSWSLTLAGLALTTAVGVVAGLVPAWQAARAEIVTSLRQV